MGIRDDLSGWIMDYLKKSGFHDGAHGKPARYPWLSDYMDAYKRGSRRDDDERAAKQAYAWECAYRGVEELNDADELVFERRFHELRDERKQKGVE